MNRTILSLLLSMALAQGWTTTRADSPEGASENFFELRVRPVIAGQCVKCHGEKKASGGLRVDSRQALLDGGESGPAVVPGDPDGGSLLRAIRHADEDLKMPPSGPLPRAVQDDLAAWIAAGAPWPESAASRPIEGQAHWAFEPLRPITPPEDPTGWASSPIDRLVAAGRRAQGVHPVARADRRTLIRRASFDLIGLPPEPERVEAFAADERPDAYERLVDELLASPHYGERWGRDWLDLARYADTAGDNSDYPIREAYLYRDYVIDAFNADVPYDRFLHEQLAGDVLAADGPPDDYARRVIATGFLAQSKRFGTVKLEDPHQIIEDTLNTTGQVVLGLSLRCARCHDHKYDPITARDYYALYGFFAGTKYPFAGSEEDHKPSEFAPLVAPEQLRDYQTQYGETLARLKARLGEAESGGEAVTKVRDLALKAAVAEFIADTAGPTDRGALVAEVEAAKAELTKAAARRDGQLQRLRGEIKKLEAGGPTALAPRAYAVRDGEPTNVKLQIGGDPTKLGELVSRGVPKVFDPAGTIDLPSTGSGRPALARWLTEGRPRPLVARVMVNRIWQHHFGKAIVPTPSDFGLRGTPPTHPELLDWLAADFVASGWSIKAMHRRIMLSETYRLASKHDSANAAIDTGNAWYWRFDRRPLDAEALRDGLLALGGNLRLDRPGPHPFPAEGTWAFSAHHQFKAVYPSEHRSIYLMVQRLHPHPYLALFNGPDTSVTTAVRDRSTVSLQALYMVNNPFVHDQARRFAGRLLAAESDASARLRLAYSQAFGRPPTGAERDRAEAFLRDYERSLADEGLPTDRREGEAWAGLTRALLASNEFLYVD
ncbi:MAG: PSD1 and planctomycete cytochrome C domain-containing protein [Paludisphaera borealis]|uniref:PSD1 and planctomycete cytochrome C domain-containing protein n=1 Tax=Paludisphaera borealis TaxID=1387353 RepID=UPI002841B9B4|nr:PSD1 and planctomycete cytochrome C domain-containing protein [Paludisphaera borealis]MDR3618957.1 PSD1 and planctomycete cytochrome C domain-containing protein [Paludisphaera borealis]